MFYLIIILMLFNTIDGSWTPDCPIACSCSTYDLTNYNDFLSEYLTENLVKKEKFTSKLRVAVCAYQRNLPESWIEKLPHDTQALVILQSPGSGTLRIDKEMFRKLTSLVFLEMKGGDIYEDELQINNDAFQYAYSLLYLNLENVKFIAVPKPHKHQEHVKFNIEFLEEKVVSYYKYKMLPVDTALFNNLSNLAFLRIADTKLEEIGKHMFEGLETLTHLILENNGIYSIDESAFNSIPQLRSLSLAHNQFYSTEYLNISSLEKLEKIDFSRNKIMYLTELSMPNVQIIDLRENPISRILPSTLEQLEKTEIMYIGSSYVSLELKHTSWIGLDNLKQLNMYNVKTHELGNGMLKGMPRLKEIEVQGKISRIAFDAFTDSPKLQIIKLSSCQIQEISMDAFYGLHGLQILDLSNNKLKTLPPGIFSRLKFLKELYLQNNKFIELPEYIFYSLRVKMIRLEGNPWECSCKMQYWRPTLTNKIKISNAVNTAVHYKFDMRVSPQCHTPIQYRDENVFHILKKELQCDGYGKALRVRNIKKRPKTKENKSQEITTKPKDEAVEFVISRNESVTVNPLVNSISNELVQSTTEATLSNDPKINALEQINYDTEKTETSEDATYFTDVESQTEKHFQVITVNYESEVIDPEITALNNESQVNLTKLTTTKNYATVTEIEIKIEGTDSEKLMPQAETEKIEMEMDKKYKKKSGTIKNYKSSNDERNDLLSLDQMIHKNDEDVIRNNNEIMIMTGDPIEAPIIYNKYKSKKYRKKGY